MTTGSVTTGIFSFPTTYHRAKKWGGDDGKRELAPPYREKWNQYQMRSMRFSSANPNKVRGVYVPWNQPFEADNNSWAYIYAPLTSTGEISGTPFDEGHFNQYWGPNEELALLSDVADKVRGHQFDLGVALSEVDKFAKTVVGTLTNLRYGINDLRNLRFGRFARRFGAKPPSRKGQRRLTTRDLSGRFLEMRYAWMPAINDVYEASKAFEELSNGPRSLNLKIRNRRSVAKTVDTNWVKVPVTIEVGRTYRIQLLEELSWSASLGLTNPLSAVWERVPYSFVVDWFIPIGDYLSNLGVIPFMNARWLRTDSMRVTSIATCDQCVYDTHILLPPYVTCNLEVFMMRRVPIGSAPKVPFPTIKVNGALHGRRIQNAIALAHQAFTKD